jgi:hypothetical protein
VPSGIPERAHLLREGDGRDLNFRAAHDGTVYVYDADDQRVVYSGDVRDGERFYLDSQKRRVYVNDQEVSDRDLARDHRYQVYFEQK